MSATNAGRPASYTDLLALPDHVVGEIVEGVLHVRPRPSLRNLRVAGSILGDLSGPFDRGRGGPGGWILLVEPELHLSADVVVPDLAGWRRERMPEMPDAPYTGIPPNWVCEVLSPSTARFDRGQKLAVYARAGVEHIWLGDPSPQLLEILALNSSDWRIAAIFEGHPVHLGQSMR